MSARRVAGQFDFVGERLCLDFVNTERVLDGRRVDLLDGFADLLRWCAAAGLVGSAEARRMASRWRTSPDAERTFQDALALRKSLREMMTLLASGRTSVPQAALDRINHVLRGRTGDLVVRRTRDGYETRFLARLSGPRQLLVPIAESAAELLSRDDLGLVKKCESPRCILYFYDTTRNHARRWCSMTACGNRAKVAAHYQRTRSEGRRPR
jgi:predicted RNA-binding Zn ribbon-like protein